MSNDVNIGIHETTLETQKITVSNANQKIRIKIGNKYTVEEFERYDGDYVVIPKNESIVLNTEEKVLEQNIEVKEVPFFESSNGSGGTTIFIGGN